jgi:hypothetical protein
MTSWWELNLIRLFDFYLALMFLAGTLRRLDQYRHLLGLVSRFPQRWPRLLALVKQHRTIFLTWATLLPAAVALGLLLLQLLASHWLWPQAGQSPGGLTLGRVVSVGWPLLPLLPLGAAMLLVDLYGLIFVGQLDRPQLEKYFDQAEYWLGSPLATVVRVLTLGWLNPRRMVHEEVRKALTSASQLLNVALWWLALQTGLRLAFGLFLWGIWALDFLRAAPVS